MALCGQQPTKMMSAAARFDRTMHRGRSLVQPATLPGRIRRRLTAMVHPSRGSPSLAGCLNRVWCSEVSRSTTPRGICSKFSIGPSSCRKTGYNSCTVERAEAAVSGSWDVGVSYRELQDVLCGFIGGEFTARLCQLLSARAVGLFIHNFGPRESGISGAIISGSGMEPAFVEGYRLVAGRNPWFAALSRAESGQVALGTEFLPAWELVRTSFYRAWLRPLNLRHALIGVVNRDAEAQESIFLVGLRASHQTPFGYAERQIFEVLLPALAGTAALTLRLQSLGGVADALLNVLDACSEAVMLVDDKAHPVILNPPARLLLAESDEIALSHGALVTASAAETAILRRLVSGERTAGPEGGHLLIRCHCHSGRTPLLLNVLHFQQPLQVRENPGGIAAAIVARRPEGEDSACLFRQHYGMTATEARLATLVATGCSLLQAAAEMNISHNTARTHMKRIYAKTDTHRQADLARLVGTGIARH